MANLFGALNLEDTDLVYNATVGQRAIYDVATAYVAQQNAALDAILGVFVERTTSDHKLKYKLPGGGKLQRGSFAPRSVPAAVKATGEWGVAWPIADYGAAIAGDRVTLAYMTAAELSRHIDTVVIQNVNTVRFEMLYALFQNVSRSFDDPLWDTLTVQPLANGDATVYPPVMGSETEATADHYIESGYAASAISDTNDPIVTIINKLEDQFGSVTGGSDLIVFINNAQTGKISGLTGFVPYYDRNIIPGTQSATVTGAPNVPGKTLGRPTSGAWTVEWRWIPANYMLGINMSAPPPLIKRIDPPATGLANGLALVAEEYEHPFKTSYWSHRFGFGAGNRLNGVVVELGTGGTYTIPTAYQ